MTRPNIRDRSFDWKRGGFIPFFDTQHFLGKSPTWMKGVEKGETATKINPVNLKKDKETLTLEVAVPGFSREELEIIIRDNILTVRGEKLVKSVKPSSSYIISEFETDILEHTFRLAYDIGQEQIQAKYEKGLLRLTFINAPKGKKKTYQTIRVN